jgi:hypothetical protein
MVREKETALLIQRFREGCGRNERKLGVDVI